MKSSFSGRSLLAAVLAMSAGIGPGFAAPITGLNHKAAPTPKRGSSRPRSRSRRGNYGKNLLAAFERKGICHSAKKNKLRKTYGQHYA